MPIKTKRSKPKRKIGLTIFNILLITLIMSAVLGAGVVFFLVKDAIAKLPTDVDVTKIENTQNPVILDGEGNILTQNLTEIRRTVVKYDDISPDMINAIIAIEDKTFWEHQGFNVVRMVGAFLESMKDESDISATSTLTQQLARNVFLPDTRSVKSYTRKIQEAYYASLLEEKLDKKTIITAYLNTIDLGYHSAGIEAAAHAYFSKSAKDLNYIESAMIASIPKSPAKFSPIRVIERAKYDGERKILGSEGANYLIVYNPLVEERAKLVIEEMYKQGMITEEERKTGLATDFSSMVKPEAFHDSEISGYFVEMTVDQVIKDLGTSLNLSPEEARTYFYTQGLKVYSTIDTAMQTSLEMTVKDYGNSQTFDEDLSVQISRYQKANDLPNDGRMNPETWTLLKSRGYLSEYTTEPNPELGTKSQAVISIRNAIASEGFMTPYEALPNVTPLFKDGIIVNAESEAWLMYNYLDAFDKNRNLYVPSGFYTKNDNGDYVLSANNKLIRFTQTEKSIYMSLSAMYNFPSNKANNHYNGQKLIPYYLLYQNMTLQIPSEYLTIQDGNLIISKDFFAQEGNGINDNNALKISRNFINFPDSPTMQPQIAVPILDPYTGYLKAVVGGRNVSGASVYNRAATPQQSGSSIKPISVYGPALDQGIVTAATIVDDVPLFQFNTSSKKPWPKNAYEGFKGRVSVRYAIYQSINTVAVQVGSMVKIPTIIEYLEKNGISSLITSDENPRVNDENLAALALGGQTSGIPPVELTSAFGTITNEGKHIPWKTYSKVTDSQGNVILDNTAPVATQVFKPETDYILLDILKGNVDESFAKPAMIRKGNKGIPVAGKTGTTSNRFDLLFAGSTPYLTATVWLGCDMDVRMEAKSDRVAKVWAAIMKPIHDGLADKNYFARPDGVVNGTVDADTGLLPDKYTTKTVQEMFIQGTVPTESDKSHRLEVTICTASGKLPGPYCPEEFIETSSFLTRVNPDWDYKGYESQIKDWRSVIVPPTDICDLHTLEWFNEQNKPQEPPQSPTQP